MITWQHDEVWWDEKERFMYCNLGDILTDHILQIGSINLEIEPTKPENLATISENERCQSYHN